MEIKLKLGDPKLSPNLQIYSDIFFSIGTENFPMEGWSDFSLIVGSWWIENLENFSDNMEFSFMDGPYDFRVTNFENSPKLELYEKSKLVKIFEIREIDEFSKMLILEFEKFAQLSIDLIKAKMISLRVQNYGDFHAFDVNVSEKSLEKYGYEKRHIDRLFSNLSMAQNLFGTKHQ